MERYDRTEFELSVVNWGSLARPICLDSSWLLPSPLEIRVLHCSRYREDTSHMRVYDLFEGRMAGLGGGQTDLSASAIFFKLLFLKISNMPRCHVLR